MNIFIFFQEKISDLYIVENRVCVKLWSSELAKEWVRKQKAKRY